MKTITKTIREERRKAAEIRQAASAAKPLNVRVKEAGAKELAKLVVKHGAEVTAKIQETSQV